MNVGPQFTHIKDKALREALLTVNHPSGEEYQGQWDEEREFIYSKGYALDGNPLNGVSVKKPKKTVVAKSLDVEIGEHHLDHDVAQQIAHAFKEEVTNAIHALYWTTKKVKKAMQGTSYFFFGDGLYICDGHGETVFDEDCVGLFMECNNLNVGQLVSILEEFDVFGGNAPLPFSYADALPVYDDPPTPKKARRKKVKEQFFVVPPGAVLTIALKKPKRRLG